MSSVNRIDGVDERLGYETDRHKTGECWMITLTICRHYDLVVPTEFQVRCQLPVALLTGMGKGGQVSRQGSTLSSNNIDSSTKNGGVSLGRVFLLNPEHAKYFPFHSLKNTTQTSNSDNDVHDETEILIPWFQNQAIDSNVMLAISKHCTLAMWFFSIRSLVKKNLQDHNYEPWRASVLLSPYICYHHPPTTISSSSSSSAVIIGGVGRNKGRRGYMEDVDFQFEYVKVQDRREVSIFGVLDGHGGSECAQFIADDIPMKITTLLRSTMMGTGSSFRGLNNANAGQIQQQPVAVAKKSRGHNTADMIYRAFQDIDEEFIKSNTASHVYQPSNAGSTANILLYDHEENRFYIANTGDTRAILHREGNNTMKYFAHLGTAYGGTTSTSTNKRVIDLSFDRKATDAEEIIRIVREGGFVLNGRVLGSLAVSRAFGDVLLKVPSKLTATTDQSSKQNSSLTRYRYVIVDPEISSFTPCIDDRFVVVATDGLWDVMSSVDVDNYVTQSLLKEEVLLPVNKKDLGMRFSFHCVFVPMFF
jgi:serine/threonine protein phosphatase PrpC